MRGKSAVGPRGAGPNRAGPNTEGPNEDSLNIVDSSETGLNTADSNSTGPAGIGHIVLPLAAICAALDCQPGDILEYVDGISGDADDANSK